MSPLPISGIELSCAHLSMYDQSASFVYLCHPTQAVATACAALCESSRSCRSRCKAELDAPQQRLSTNKKPQPCQICLRGRCHARRWNMHCYDTKQRGSAQCPGCDSALTSEELTNSKRFRSVGAPHE